MTPGLSVSSSMFAYQPYLPNTNFAAMGMGGSIYSAGAASGSTSTYASANETAEQREKRIEREIANKNRAIDSQTQKAQQELIAQMQKFRDVFSALETAIEAEDTETMKRMMRLSTTRRKLFDRKGTEK